MYVPKLKYWTDIKIYGFVVGEEPLTTPAPPKQGYDVEVKLIKLGQNYQAPLPGTTEFEILAKQVSTGFERALRKLPGFQSMTVKEFKQ